MISLPNVEPPSIRRPIPIFETRRVRPKAELLQGAGPTRFGVIPAGPNPPAELVRGALRTNH